MLNHITIMGRLTKDPELHRTQSGTAVASITVAVDRDYRNGDERETDFIDVVAWRGTAEFLCNYFRKGRMIVVDGSLQSRKWTDKNGQARVSWEVQANTLYFGDSKRDGDTSNTYDERRAPAKPVIVQVDEEDENGELPF